MIMVLLLFPFFIFDDYFTSPERSIIAIILWSVLYSIIAIGYSVLLHARYGQTVGKMIAGVKVLDLSENRLPTLNQAFMRDIGYIVPAIYSFLYLSYVLLVGSYDPETHYETVPEQINSYAGTVWLIVEIITMLFNEKRRALHDLIAGTVVVKTSEVDV